MFNLSSLKYLFNSITTQQLWIGYSGGLDSHVLLHALVQLINTQAINISLKQIHAVYINHGWHKDAEKWAEHCRQICQQLNVDYHTIKITIDNHKGASPEAAARFARYQAFADLLKPGDYLLTAHQQDDQAETLLTQLLRGAGVKGLASMPVLTTFANGWHLRPLLTTTRADLLAYAKQQQLVWIEDDSNTNPRFTRNFLRHTIFPLLKQRWPNVDTAIARSAAHCAEAAELLEEVAKEDLLQVKGSQINTLSCQALLKLTAARQKNVLRYWFTQLNIKLPTTIKLQHIIQDVLYSKMDACPQVSWQNKIITRYQDNLFIIDPPKLPSYKTLYSWNLIDSLTIANLGTLTANLTISPLSIREDVLQTSPLTVRFRQYGERCQPAGRQGSHPLKKLMQEWHIPPWERQRVPLLYCGDQLVAVIGYCVTQAFAAKKNEKGWLIQYNTEQI